MIPAPGNGSSQTPPPPAVTAVTADPTPLAQTPATNPLPLVPSMFVAATDGGVFSNWFIPLWMLPPIPGDGKLDANALLQILSRTTELVQTQMESASQSPVPGQLPISQLIIPTMAMLTEPMFAHWTASGAPPGQPLYTEPRLIPPGTDASQQYPEMHSDRVAFSEAFQPLLDACCEDQVFLLREKSISPPTEAELHALIEAMAGNRHTHDLVLAAVACPGLLDMLAKVLARNTSVHGLYLPRSCGAGSGAALAELIGRIQGLQLLDISHCELTVADWRTIGNTLAPNSLPEDLHIGGELPSGCGAALATLLKANACVKLLDLSDSRKPKIADWTAILRALADSTTLEELRIASCSLEGAGVALGSFFLANRSLKRLDIRSEDPPFNRAHIKVEDWFVIADGVKNNKSLQSMNARGACMQGAGAALATILIRNHTIRQLDISACPSMTIGDWLAVWAALKVNPTLEELNAGHGAMEGSGFMLSQALIANHRLKRLDLGHCTMTSDDLLALGKALPANHSLENLTLGHAHSLEKQTAIRTLLTALPANASLKALGLPDMQPAQNIAALAEVLRIHPTLRELDLGIIANEEGMVAALSGAMGSAARLTCVKLDLDSFRPISHVDADDDNDMAQERQPRKARVAEIFDALGQCASLERVEIGDAFFHLDTLLAFLRKHPHIREVEVHGNFMDDKVADFMTALLDFAKNSGQLTHCRISTKGLWLAKDPETLNQLEKNIEQAAALNLANHRQLPAATQGMAMMLGLQANEPDALPELPLDITRALATAAVRHTRPNDAKRIVDTLSSYAPREEKTKE